MHKSNFGMLLFSVVPAILIQGCMTAQEREAASIREFDRMKESEAYERQTIQKMNSAFSEFSLCTKAYAESNAGSASAGDIADASIARCAPQKDAYAVASTSAFLAYEYSQANALHIPPRVTKATADADSATSQGVKSVRDAAVLWAIDAQKAKKRP